MGKTLGYIKLLLILRGKDDAKPFTVGFGIGTQVHRHIVDSTAHRPYQLALGILLLEMQSSQYALDGHGLVVLYEHHVETCFPKIILIVGLHKISSLILKNRRFNHTQPLDVTGGHFNLSHNSIRSFFIVKHA